MTNKQINKDTIPLVNVDETITKLEDLELFKNFAIAAFNPMVRECYWKGRSSEEHSKAIAALTIKKSDSQITILNKQIMFWLTLGKYANEKEEKIFVGKPFQIKTDDDYDNISAKIRLVPRNKFVDGENTGYRYIKVPHVDPSKLGNLRNFNFKFGQKCFIYKFADKREIKLRAYDEQIGHDAINELLRLVKDSFYAGKSEEHSSILNIPSDIDRHSLYGRIADGKAINVMGLDGINKITIFI